MTKEAVDDLWASFNAPEPAKAPAGSVAGSATTAPSQPSTSSSSAIPSTSTSAYTPASKPKAELVKIKVTYNFVGETIE